jgi:cation diffusion facilitator CzcD-associated flavoprotein CzcO
MVDSVDVAVVGGGPYAISLVAHLRQRPLEVRAFGAPMRFWRDMPRGRAVKSFAFATNIYVPQRGFRFVEYCRERGLPLEEPIDMQQFAQYGLWVQQELVPDLCEDFVDDVSRDGSGFRLRLATGEELRAGQVVVATGLTHLARFPSEVPAASPHVSHTSTIRDYTRFAGKNVMVIGGGQSALEAAGMVRRDGGTPCVAVRGDGVWFSDRFPEHRTLAQRWRDPLTPLGPGRLNWVLSNAPWLFPRLSEERRVRMVRRHNPPFGTWWVRDQLGDAVPILVRTRIVAVDERADGLTLTLEGPDGRYRVETDHLIVGTGFEPNVDALPFLAPELRSQVARVVKGPSLSHSFESSVRGLYFVGPAAAFCFGPTMRFVCGGEYAAPTIARAVTKLARRTPAGPAAGEGARLDATAR